MKHLFRAFLLLALLIPAACSMQGALDRLVSAEDRAFAFGFVDSVRRGDLDRLKPLFDQSDPKLWASTEADLPRARLLFPEEKGETRLVSYNGSTNISPGLRETRKQFVLVTSGRAHWTRTRLETYARNGPARIVSWNVEGLADPPPELQIMQSWDAALPWIRLGLALVVAGFAALIWWLVRRSRRRAAG